MDSGTSLCIFGLSRKAKQAAFAVGVSLGLLTTSTQTLVDGLRKTDYKKLQEISMLIFDIVIFIHDAIIIMYLFLLIISILLRFISWCWLQIL